MNGNGSVGYKGQKSYDIQQFLLTLLLMCCISFLQEQTNKGEEGGQHFSYKWFASFWGVINLCGWMQDHFNY